MRVFLDTGSRQCIQQSALFYVGVVADDGPGFYAQMTDGRNGTDSGLPPLIHPRLARAHVEPHAAR